MRKQVVWLSVILIVLLLAGCGPAQPTAAPTAASTTAPQPTPAAAVLELAGPAGAKKLTMAEVQALPAVEGWGGIKSSTGKITPPAKFKGVALPALCALVGELKPEMGVSVVAEDGYAMTLSADQVLNGTFTFYDPGTGDEVKIDEAAQVIVAYEQDGQPLPEKEDGKLRLVVVTSKNNQVVDGHWSVKWVNKVELKTLAKEWTLRLEGVISEDMDRGTFESGSAPSCHGATWTDDKAQVWTGITLWRLLGRVDDEVKHGDNAYNQALADQGYTVDVVAADGYMVSFPSSRTNRNDNIIVAYLVNGNPLDDKYFPLRLVGSDLQKNEMAGQIVKIVIHLTTAQPTVAPPPAAQAALTITGAVENKLELTMADLQAMGVVTITAEHPKKGPQTYQGVRLNQALEQAKVKAGATQLLFVARDGFTATVAITDVRACADCLLAFDAGTLKTVMPGMSSNVWVKDLIRIEVGPVPAAGLALTITGLVEKELSLAMADLQAVGVVTLDLEHPKKGKQSYTGVRLNALLDAAKVKAEAKTLVFISSDGYQVEVNVADVRACADCLVAIDSEGKLNLAMAGMQSNFWSKDVVKIEVK